MSRKPNRALAVLRSTRIADLNNDSRNQRLLLEARALSNLGRHDVALEVVAGLSGNDSAAFRHRGRADRNSVRRSLAGYRVARRKGANRYIANCDWLRLG